MQKITYQHKKDLPLRNLLCKGKHMSLQCLRNLRIPGIVESCIHQHLEKEVQWNLNLTNIYIITNSSVQP